MNLIESKVELQKQNILKVLYLTRKVRGYLLQGSLYSEDDYREWFNSTFLLPGMDPTSWDSRFYSKRAYLKLLETAPFINIANINQITDKLVLILENFSLCLLQNTEFDTSQLKELTDLLSESPNYSKYDQNDRILEEMQTILDSLRNATDIPQVLLDNPFWNDLSLQELRERDSKGEKVVFLAAASSGLLIASLIKAWLSTRFDINNLTVLPLFINKDCFRYAIPVSSISQSLIIPWDDSTDETGRTLGMICLAAVREFGHSKDTEVRFPQHIRYVKGIDNILSGKAPEYDYEILDK